MRLLLLLLTAIIFQTSHAQVLIRTERAADRAFEQYAYAKAARLYKVALVEGPSDSLSVMMRVADSHRYLNQPDSVEKYLQIAHKISADTLAPQYYYYLAEALVSNQKYDSARLWYARYDSLLKEDNRPAVKLEALENLEDFYADSVRYEVSRLPINSPGLDFSPMFYRGGIVFVSSRPLGSQWLKNDFNWDESSFLDLFYAPNDVDQDQVEYLGGALKSQFHEGPLDFYDNDRQVVFTRNNLEGNKVKRDKQGVARLKLYFASYNETEESWENINPFEHNSDSYSMGHPAISESGDVLIFTSDMPGGKGETDLYISYKRNNSWSEPIPLGDRINTLGREMFPTLKNRRLYFASDGLGGLGGLDIYAVDLDENYQVVERPRNLGYPVNSGRDDFGFVVTDDFKMGYFTSARYDETKDDVFKFYYGEPKVYGYVLNEANDEPLPGADVFLLDTLTNTEIYRRSNMDGAFEIPASGPRWHITASKFGFRALNSDVFDPIDDTVANEVVIYLTDRPEEPEPAKPIYKLLVTTIDAGEGDTLKPNVQYILSLESSDVQYAEGRTEYEVDPGQEYEIFTAKDGYLSHRDTVKIADPASESTLFTVSLKKVVVGESIRLENIYYDLNSADLRKESEKELDKLVQFMEDNPKIRIELSSHTDSRGSAAYNLQLSQRRAESATNYLLQHGIATDRIVPKGYGETKLVNRCADGVSCSKTEHQQNRRTEITILE
ncbi:OmpA family protein [Marinoscillum furvescens]|uniref:OmpA family protein n=1 Tax=Marinoscillum furvescens DSM 4134 TaxID=1122208 RepID=A0A3D9L356_MARFU|nr:OmpA family protein [Marinoscillum furvescens]RED97091.1 OmpA family protein [Marinoscillum furvescens DSM 4134]